MNGRESFWYRASSGSETKASKSPTNLPDVLAQEIVEDLEPALEQFRESSRI
jgi:hypothetical protein